MSRGPKMARKASPAKLPVDDIVTEKLRKVKNRKFLARAFARKVWQHWPDDPTASKVWWCASRLTLDPTDGAILAADFCRERWCSICQWRRSRLLYLQNAQVAARLIEDHRFVLLTLTVRNVPLDQLADRMADMSTGWNRLMSRCRKHDVEFDGYSRATEITYNPSADSWHPHYHAILTVPDTGWLPDRDWWLQVWRDAVDDPEISQVDIRVIDGPKGIAEASKYIVKSKDILTGFDFRAWPQLQAAVKGLRFYAAGGVWRQLRKELRQVSPDDPSAQLVDKAARVWGSESWEWSELLQAYSKTGVTTMIQRSVELAEGRRRREGVL